MKSKKRKPVVLQYEDATYVVLTNSKGDLFLGCKIFAGTDDRFKFDLFHFGLSHIGWLIDDGESRRALLFEGKGRPQYFERVCFL